ncbi:hypothetical protein T03_5609 [Trichinella britovi]|uniref:Uncharacterized protein n=1 Tax=Trichinella britovi TaxID=45882 RepID=A0A0V1C2Z4_TRIBR|nr:hypothetical protein T03_5609 [Trichinella britovi]
MEKSSKKAEKGIYGIYGKIRALDEFIIMGMPILCIDAEKYFKQRTILKRDSSKLIYIYIFTPLFNALNHIMFVVSTKKFYHGHPGVETETP